MSANKLYREYKILSEDLFIPIVYDKSLSADHYKQLANRYERCANLRRLFQLVFVSENLRDDGHQKAIDAATLRMEEAQRLYTRAVYEQYASKANGTDENPFSVIQLPESDSQPAEDVGEPSHATDPAPIEKKLSKRAKRSKSKKARKLKKKVAAEEDEYLTIEAFKCYEEKIALASLIFFEVLCNFWNDYEDLEDRDPLQLSLISWEALSWRPLVAKDILQLLKTNNHLLDTILFHYDDKDDDIRSDLLYETFCRYEDKLDLLGIPLIADDIIDDVDERGFLKMPFGLLLLQMRADAIARTSKSEEREIRKMYTIKGPTRMIMRGMM